MTRTGWDAILYARSRVGPNAMPASGYCLQFVRECYAIGAYYGSAIDAWHGSRTQHPGDRHPPIAVPVYFLTPSVYDHVAFYGDHGEIITTFNDDVRRYTGSSGSDVIAQIERDFDGSFLGWCEDLNGVRVLEDAGPPPDPIAPPIDEHEEGNKMPNGYYLKGDQAPQVYYVDVIRNGQRRYASSGEVGAAGQFNQATGGVTGAGYVATVAQADLDAIPKIPGTVDWDGSIVPSPPSSP